MGMDERDSYDVVLTKENMAALPVGSVISVLMLAADGSDCRIPIVFQKHGRTSWDVHGRSWVNSKNLVGGRAKLRKHRMNSDPLPVPETVQEAAPKARVTFGDAAARMLTAPR